MVTNKPKQSKDKFFGKNIIATNNVDKVLVWTTDRRYLSLGSCESWGYRTGRIYPKKLKNETLINKGQNGNPVPVG